MNNPFDYVPDAECDAAFDALLTRIEALKRSDREVDVDFCRRLDEGVMLGVLIAADTAGESQVLYAFSGQLGETGFYYDGFVEPVFDYLSPDGYFKVKEAQITLSNRTIADFEAGCVAEARNAYESAKLRLDAEIAEYKERCRVSKTQRDMRRARGNMNDHEQEAMIKQSQFEKAELARLKRRVAYKLAPFAAGLQEAEARLAAMKDERRAESEALQGWLFANFKLLNARGESRSLSDIFADTPAGVPPSGAGECCAPKLLQGAYRRGWRPIAMAEYWYGKPKGGDVRVHGHYYPSCRGRCLPVLRWMLQGLDVVPPLDSEDGTICEREPEIVFENEWFCVVNKPSGMLSVPGRGATASVESWLRDRCGTEREIRMAHRLDQDTSGLIVAAFGLRAYKELQSLFATRRVKKVYVAELAGDYESIGIARSGRIELPLSPDWLDRPRQHVDFAGGKEAVTDYEFVGACDGRSRVLFSPHTGRTHQLRVHAAAQSGLAMPIVGDRLYGDNCGGTERLHLHAQKLEFTFTVDGQHYCFEAPAPF